MKLVLSGVYPVGAEIDIAGVEVRYKAEKGKVNKEICLSVKEKLEKKYDTEIEYFPEAISV